jgi:GST-like protein
MAGQNNHFKNYAVEKIPYAIDRYVKETNRLYGVLNKRLADREFIAGEYSNADMASYPWIVPYERQGQDLAGFPHLKRWFETIQARPAIQRAYELAKKINPNQPAIRTEEERKILFGQNGGVSGGGRTDRLKLSRLCIVAASAGAVTRSPIDQDAWRR